MNLVQLAVGTALGVNLNQQKKIHSVKNIGQFLINGLLFLLNLFIIIDLKNSFFNNVSERGLIFCENKE